MSYLSKKYVAYQLGRENVKFTLYIENCIFKVKLCNNSAGPFRD